MRDARCPSCRRLLARAAPGTRIEIMCRCRVLLYVVCDSRRCSVVLQAPAMC